MTDMLRWQDQFSGLSRLYGPLTESRLAQAHVLIVGLGGVGSWTVEALARSGVGQLTLVDMDEVCISNSNRQLPALTTTVGKAKAEVLKNRVHEISPNCRVNCILDWFDATTAERILAESYSYVVDAIDGVSNKCLLIAECRRRDYQVVTVGGAGAKKDPTRIKIDDLSKTYGDRLLQKVRQTLRKDYSFPRDKKKFKVKAVFSDEVPSLPPPQACDGPKIGKALDCATGLGTSVFVTASFGLFASSVVVNDLMNQTQQLGASSKVF